MERFKYKKVLLVDDSYIDNLINRRILENNTFSESIVVIDSPEKAFQYVRECLSDGKNLLPEVIFLDLRMPEMSGFEFLTILGSILESEPHNIKIYVLSSSLDPSDLKKIKENSLVSKFISKPLTNQALEDL